MLIRDYPQGPCCSRNNDTIHCINHYSVDNVACFINTYNPLDTDLFGGGVISPSGLTGYFTSPNKSTALFFNG